MTPIIIDQLNLSIMLLIVVLLTSWWFFLIHPSLFSYNGLVLNGQKQ